MSSRYCVVALGTRGDVEPILALACGLREGRGQEDVDLPQLPAVVHFITHAEHCLWINEYTRIKVLHLSYVSSAARQSGESEQQLQRQRELHAAVLAAVCEEAHECHFIFNLFALETVHIAEQLVAAPVCTAVSPYVMPTAQPPIDFHSWLSHEAPTFHARLLASPDRLAALNHYLFPLLNSCRWQEFRRFLGLLPMLADAEASSTDTSTWPWWTNISLLYGFSPSFVPALRGIRGFHELPPGVLATGYWRMQTPDCVQVDASCWTKNTVLISLGSMPSLGIFGTEQTESSYNSAAADLQATVNVVAFLYAVSLAIVQAGPDARGVVSSGCWSGYRDALAFLASRSAPSLAVQDLQRLVSERLCFLPGSLPFDAILPRVGAVLHHGGSGHFSAAMHAGTPQVVVPCMHDQFTWRDFGVASSVAADMVSTMPSDPAGVDHPVIARIDFENVLRAGLDAIGRFFEEAVAVDPSKLSLVLPPIIETSAIFVLGAGIRTALYDPATRLAAEALSRTLAAEDGVSVAALAIARLCTRKLSESVAAGSVKSTCEATVVSRGHAACCIAAMAHRIRPANWRISHVDVREVSSPLDAASCTSRQQCITALYLEHSLRPGETVVVPFCLYTSSVIEASFLLEEIVLQQVYFRYSRVMPTLQPCCLIGAMSKVSTGHAHDEGPWSRSGRVLPPPMPLTIVDIGANIGIFALALQAHLYASGLLEVRCESGPVFYAAPAMHCRYIGAEPASCSYELLALNVPAAAECHRHLTESSFIKSAVPLCEFAISDNKCAEARDDRPAQQLPRELPVSAQLLRTAIVGPHSGSSTLALMVFPHLPGNSTAKPLLKRAQKAEMAARGLGRLYADAYTEFVPAMPLTAMLESVGIPAVPPPAAEAPLASYAGSSIRCGATEPRPREPSCRCTIDFLKVDVEGYELEVLQGGVPHLRGVRELVAEVHDDGDRVARVVALLADPAGAAFPARGLRVERQSASTGGSLAAAGALMLGISTVLVYAVR